MARAIWQLLLKDPSDLTCDECFALMEYYAELLARDGIGLLPKIIERLKRCPDCEPQNRKALQFLRGSQSEVSAAPASDLTETRKDVKDSVEESEVAEETYSIESIGVHEHRE